MSEGGRVLWHVAMSLDGYTTGPDDAMDWIRGFAGPTDLVGRIVAGTGAILAGRRWFDVVSGSAWSDMAPYGGAWSGPIFVLTHKPLSSTDLPVRFLSGSLRDAVRTAKQAADGKDVVLFGATLSGAALREGLVDEIVVHIAPLLLGGGVRLYDVASRPLRLERVGEARTDDLVTLRYRVSA